MAEERTVLIVDDENVITWAISRGLAKQGEIHTETAQSGEEALDVLKRHPFDLVITDIRMKGMTGFELLSRIRTLYPETGVIVMTAYGSAEAKREASERGSLFYLDKTFEIEEMRSVVRRALEQVDKTRQAMREQQAEGFSGQIGNLNLVDMVQLHCLARNTGMMDVRSERRCGVIGFADGEVVFAETDTGMEGREAFIDMLGWSGGQFETENTEPDEQNIDENWEALLLEATDVITTAAEAARVVVQGTSNDGEPVRAGVSGQPTNIHSLLEDLAIEQGVLGVFVMTDSGFLIDQVVTTYPGNPDDIAKLGKSLEVITAVRLAMEPEVEQNRVILQFEKTRLLALEIGSTGLYLVAASSASGSLARLLPQLNNTAKRLVPLV